MIIKSIQINKLHGQYNRYVEFDSKLTYLYGANGCGKTTILNILSAIITGHFYDLCEYFFEEVRLCYGKGDGNETIVLKMIESEKETSLQIVFDGEDYKIDDFKNLKERLYRHMDDEGMEKTFIKMYPFVDEISKTFNYVYLPLNRFGGADFLERDVYRFGYPRRRYLEMQQNPYNSYLNDSLIYISQLIKDSCMKINFSENRINDQFRKNVLSSMISVSDSNKLLEVFDGIQKFKWEEVEDNKSTYIKTLDEIGVYDKNLEEEIDYFFKSFKKAYEEYSNNSDKTLLGVNLAWQYAEFTKIRKITELAKDFEKTKNRIRRPRELFLELIEGFFNSSGTKKKPNIDKEGRLYFEIGNRRLNLRDLSSGEKQIVITFASMIFGLKGKQTGIFIVDEPEASLHLEWQKKFVPSILQTEKNVQLIFATHSPELIGQFRDNAFEII